MGERRAWLEQHAARDVPQAVADWPEDGARGAAWPRSGELAFPLDGPARCAEALQRWDAFLDVPARCAEGLLDELQGEPVRYCAGEALHWDALP